MDDEDRELWTGLLALRPSEDTGHDPACAGIDEWLRRRDRLGTCHACTAFLVDVWREDRRLRAFH